MTRRLALLSALVACVYMANWAHTTDMGEAPATAFSIEGRRTSGAGTATVYVPAVLALSPLVGTETDGGVF